MMVDEWGFPHPSVDESACVGCARSVVVCPSLSEAGSDSALSAFWARSRDEGELVRSSSGGVFGLLAADVLASGGVVSVAAWGPGFRSVSHRPIEDPSDLDARVRSKYVQSSVSVGGLPGRPRRSSTREEGSIFGTACQVAGIRGHLAPLLSRTCFSPSTISAAAFPHLCSGLAGQGIGRPLRYTAPRGEYAE